MAPLRVSPRLTVPPEAMEERFLAASGPGGQNVNKVASAVQLRLLPERVPGLGEAALERLRALAGRRMGSDGTLLLVAREHREQERNRQAARARLAALLRAALQPPRARRPTRPTLASRERRLEGKAHRSSLKRGRAAAPEG